MTTSTIAIKKVRVAEVFEWLKLSFNCFIKHPFLLISYGLIYFFSGITINFFTHGFGAVINIWLMVFFISSFAKIAKRIEEGEKIQFSTFFEGFFTKSLIKLGAILAISFIVIITVPFSLAWVIYNSFDYQPLLATLLFVLLFLWAIAYAFSPALCKFNPQMGALMAIKLSYKGFFKNFLAMLVYGIMAILITLVAAIPLGLGLLVSIPVLNMLAYFSYKSIFKTENINLALEGQVSNE